MGFIELVLTVILVDFFIMMLLLLLWMVAREFSLPNRIMFVVTLRLFRMMFKDRDDK